MPSEASPDDYAMLAVAFHKEGEAYEGVREWGKATFAYTQAYEVVRRSLGPNHHLTRSFEKSSRCPHHLAPLGTGGGGGNVGSVGGVGSYTARGSPSLSGSGGSRAATPRTREGLAVSLPPCRNGRSPNLDFEGYQLPQDLFTTWHPKSLDEEEKRWYRLAEGTRKQVTERQRRRGAETAAYGRKGKTKSSKQEFTIQAPEAETPALDTGVMDTGDDFPRSSTLSLGGRKHTPLPWQQE